MPGKMGSQYWERLLQREAFTEAYNNDIMHYMRAGLRLFDYDFRTAEPDEWIWNGPIPKEVLNIVIDEALKILSERHRKIIRLVYWEERKIPDIAEEMDLTRYWVYCEHDKAIEVLGRFLGFAAKIYKRAKEEADGNDRERES